ncbi:ferredoxin reductase family protein [Alkalimonas amylolytica]|uniref:Predicted ferric reductase n=1 Tax=Alkalimonas amylolytica TaxID=152573 RepID=A0A1H4CHZ1_ALKAM|nr:ferric reductase-like transmembrane domain-containing protein [Alkalimonas amylolytica]SEA59977.1 Predicted ferric reductase [Alkalimonas amylolytica]
MRIHYQTLAAWIGVYFLLTLLPMALALAFERPPVRAFAIELGVLLGLLGLGVLAMQLVISGRHPWFARGIGQDNLLQFHRQMGIFAWLLVLAHPATLLSAEPAFLDYLHPGDEPLRAFFLSATLIATTLLIVTSLWRVGMKLQYEWWRALHGLLAFFVVSTGIGHALMVSNYTAGWPVRIALTVAVGAALLLLIDARLLRPWRLKTKPWLVTKADAIDGDATRLVLQADNHQGIQFKPGQYVWITLGDSPFSLQQHPFSIHSNADSPTRLEFTVKHAGDFTNSISAIKAGSRAWVEGPYGVFTLDLSNDRDTIMVVGGVGITPIMSMLRSCATAHSRKKLLLLYANENRASVLFWDELIKLSEHLDLKVVHVLKEPPEDWDEEQGFIDDKLLTKYIKNARSQTDYYVCGPPPLMNGVESALRKRDVPLQHIFSERFNLV